ncbi:hypothetical protein Q1695_001025 [Nippostrongylus brasiliensis]|nr:hypothetical protein Q1695_001022 [Nippostrongylus brasiliensis]WKY16017.1 hypothetical protein Q1695_001025 [Nippostrongylus brasiliensis]
MSQLHTTFVEHDAAYFECLQMGDGDTCTVKNARGEQILIHSADEVVVEPSAVKKSESQKVANFLNNLRRDPEWARSLPYVKLNATVPKDLQLDLISHLFLNVNHRPQYMLVLSKEMNVENIADFLKLCTTFTIFYSNRFSLMVYAFNIMAFEPSEIAMQRTLFRLNCRNPLHSLKSLIRLLIHETSIRAYIEVKYSEVLGELIHKDSKIRAKTDRIKDFCKYEEQGRALGMRFLTTFSCRSIADPQRSLEIRYYDEMKNGSRVVEMVPVSQSYPPVHDLIELIKKLSSRST